MFKKVSKNCKEIVYEDYIKEHIDKKYHINSLVLYHSINNFKKMNSLGNNDEFNSFFQDDRYLRIISLSGNVIDLKIIEELISLDKDGYFNANKIRIYLKDKRISYKSNFLIVSNYYLSDEEYSFAFQKCDYCLLVYNPIEYIYRVSGVYFDSLTFNKPVIYSNTLFFKNQVLRFGEIGVELKDSLVTTFESIKSIDYSNVKNNIMKARDFYSDENIISNLKEIVK